MPATVRARLVATVAGRIGKIDVEGLEIPAGPRRHRRHPRARPGGRQPAAVGTLPAWRRHVVPRGSMPSGLRRVHGQSRRPGAIGIVRSCAGQTARYGKAVIRTPDLPRREIENDHLLRRSADRHAAQRKAAPAKPASRPMSAARYSIPRSRSAGWTFPSASSRASPRISLVSMLRDALVASNVGLDFVKFSERPTTLAFVRLMDGHATYLFYDENTAGRMLVEADLPQIGERSRPCISVASASFPNLAARPTRR